MTIEYAARTARSSAFAHEFTHLGEDEATAVAKYVRLVAESTGSAKAEAATFGHSTAEYRPLQFVQRKGGDWVALGADDACQESVLWWAGEYDAECELPSHHEGPHFDGLSWWDDDRVEVSDPEQVLHEIDLCQIQCMHPKRHFHRAKSGAISSWCPDCGLSKGPLRDWGQA